MLCASEFIRACEGCVRVRSMLILLVQRGRGRTDALPFPTVGSAGGHCRGLNFFFFFVNATKKIQAIGEGRRELVRQ